MTAGQVAADVVLLIAIMHGKGIGAATGVYITRRRRR